MFKKLWKFVKKNAGTIIGGAIGGPFGAIIGALIDNVLLRSGNLPPHLEAQVDQFASMYVEPVLMAFFAEIKNATPEQLNTQAKIDKLNLALRKLATIKAFYEWKSVTTSSSQDQGLVNMEIISGLGASIQILTDAYAEAAPSNSNFTKRQISFKPTDYNSVGSLALNWTGAQTITGSYIGYAQKGDGKPLPGGTITIPSKPKPTTPILVQPGTISNPKPSTGGSTKPSSGGGTVKPTPSLPPATPTTPTTRPGNGEVVNNYKPLPEEPATKSNNKKYWIIGAAIAAGLYLSRQK